MASRITDIDGLPGADVEAAHFSSRTAKRGKGGFAKARAERFAARHPTGMAAASCYMQGNRVVRWLMGGYSTAKLERIRKDFLTAVPELIRRGQTIFLGATAKQPTRAIMRNRGGA